MLGSKLIMSSSTWRSRKNFKMHFTTSATSMRGYGAGLLCAATVCIK